MSVSKKYLSILPNNIPASGRVSHARGNPILTITLGRQDGVVDLSTLRLSGNLDIWRSAGGLADNERPTAANAAELRGSHKLGIYACIDQLVFRHAETKQVIEHLRHTGRFMSSFLPIMASTNGDYAGHLMETALVHPNYDSFTKSVIRNTRESPFCIPLVSGLTLGGTKLPLSKVPLEIEIHLTPDAQMFYSSDGNTTNIANCFYELSALELNCEVEYNVPTPDKGILSFNSITSYFSTLESTNSIINFNLGLSKVLAAFVNFVPSNFINNLAQDGFLTYMPTVGTTGGPPSTGGGGAANLQTISFLRNGERFPKSFEVQSVRSDSNLTNVADPQVIKDFLHSIIPERHHTRTSISPMNSNRGFETSDIQTEGGYRFAPDSGCNYGVGQLYDMLDSEGVDFSNAQFSIQMTNDLNDGNPNSAYLFIKSKVSVAWDAQMGVQIIM